MINCPNIQRAKDKIISILESNGFSWKLPLGTVLLSANKRAIIEINEYERCLRYKILFTIENDIIKLEEQYIDHSFFVNEYKAHSFANLTEDEKNFILIWSIN